MVLANGVDRSMDAQERLARYRAALDVVRQSGDRRSEGAVLYSKNELARR